MNSPGKSAPMTDLEHGTVYFKFFFLPFYFAYSKEVLISALWDKGKCNSSEIQPEKLPIHL